MKQFLIIGNSAAGISAAEAIRQTDKSAKILIFSDEGYASYCRYLIPHYLSGEVEEDRIWYRQDAFYKENNIELLLNKRVIRVDPEKNRIVCLDKSQFNYDALLIATGSSTKFPEIKGIKKRGVFGLRTLKDAKEIAGLLPVVRDAYVVGAGLAALKAAYALKKRNIETTVIVKPERLLPEILDCEASGLLERRLEENGLEIILGQDVLEVIGDKDIKALKLDPGKVVEASLVIVSKEVSINVDLIKGTQVKINIGILRDKSMQTNVPNIYTAGDVCESEDFSSGEPLRDALWPIAIGQGRVAGANMAGNSLNYDGALAVNSIEFFGLQVISLGVCKAKGQDENFSELKSCGTQANIYKKLILKDDFIVGATLVGGIKNSGVFLKLIREKINISPFKDDLLKEDFEIPA